MKIKLKDAVQIAEMLIKREREMENFYKEFETFKKFTNERMYELENKILSVNCKVDDTNRE